MNSITGLPAHPLLVHIPVAMLPLAAFGVLLLVVRQAWYERYRWVVLFVGMVGTFGAIIASSSGEGLQADIRARDGIEAARAVHEHAESGEMARTLAILFLVALVGYVTLPSIRERYRGTSGIVGRIEARLPSWTPLLMKVAAVLMALVSTASIIAAGHSGASDVWKDTGTAAASY